MNNSLYKILKQYVFYISVKRRYNDFWIFGANGCTVKIPKIYRARLSI